MSWLPLIAYSLCLSEEEREWMAAESDAYCIHDIPAGGGLTTTIYKETLYGEQAILTRSGNIKYDV